MGTVRVSLHSGKYLDLYAIVDDEDAELVSQYHWKPKKPSRVGASFYAVSNHRVHSHQISIRMHRLILGITDPYVQVDHINNDGLDNRRINIRACISTQNAMNRPKRRGSRSPFKGVTWNDNRSKWYVRITVNGKVHSLGHFEDEVEAARAYDAAARSMFSAFARLNFPIDDEQSARRECDR